MQHKGNRSWDFNALSILGMVSLGQGRDRVKVSLILYTCFLSYSDSMVVNLAPIINSLQKMKLRKGHIQYFIPAFLFLFNILTRDNVGSLPWNLNITQVGLDSKPAAWWNCWTFNLTCLREEWIFGKSSAQGFGLFSVCIFKWYPDKIYFLAAVIFIGGDCTPTLKAGFRAVTCCFRFQGWCFMTLGWTSPHLCLDQIP